MHDHRRAHGRLRHHEAGRESGGARDVVGQTVDYLQSQLGPDAWTEGMNPEIPETTVLDNPYTYTEWDAGSAQWKGGIRADGTA